MLVGAGIYKAWRFSINSSCHCVMRDLSWQPLLLVNWLSSILQQIWPWNPCSAVSCALLVSPTSPQCDQAVKHSWMVRPTCSRLLLVVHATLGENPLSGERKSGISSSSLSWPPPPPPPQRCLESRGDHEQFCLPRCGIQGVCLHLMSIIPPLFDLAFVINISSCSSSTSFSSSLVYSSKWSHLE